MANTKPTDMENASQTVRGRTSLRLNGIAARAGVLCLGVGLLVGLLAGSARANQYGIGPPHAGWLPNSANHTYCWGSTFTSGTYRSIATARMNYLASATAMNVQFGSTCGAGTNVRFELFSNPNIGTRGYYECLTMAGGICYAAVVALNTALLTDTNNREKTTCHEIGHSVGLIHGTSTDCMLNGPVSNPTRTYTIHNRNHINDWLSCLANPMCSALTFGDEES